MFEHRFVHYMHKLKYEHVDILKQSVISIKNSKDYTVNKRVVLYMHNICFSNKNLVNTLCNLHE